jgi:endonuclease/exonuclease/phosphatase family metal-dependent hydrolase
MGKTKGRLDYIFINSKIAYDYNIIKCNVDDSSLKKEISDHKILKIELKEI